LALGLLCDGRTDLKELAMRTGRLLSMVLTASLVGCGAGDITPGTNVVDPTSKSNATVNGTAGGGGTTGGGGGGGRTGGGGGGSGPFLVAGRYDVTTQYNLLDALPPDVKNILQMALDFADSPGAFLLDQADKLPVIKYVIDAVNLFSGVRD